MPRQPSKLVHGTCVGYNRWRCRCDLCTAAIRDYNKSWLQTANQKRPRLRICEPDVGRLDCGKNLAKLIGSPTPVQMHCRIFVQNGKPYYRRVIGEPLRYEATE
jgi:hypothetical protein